MVRVLHFRKSTPKIANVGGTLVGWPCDCHVSPHLFHAEQIECELKCPHYVCLVREDYLSRNRRITKYWMVYLHYAIAQLSRNCDPDTIVDGLLFGEHSKPDMISDGKRIYRGYAMSSL